MSETDPRESNPNAGGPEGLQGDMGVSSERTGPFGGDDAADEGIQGTGSHGSSAENTDGTMSTERQHAEEPAEGSPDIDDDGAADGPEMDHTQQQATQQWRDQQPPADQATSTDTELSDDEPSVDRTVGESNTAEVPSQDFDPTKNPGHSHG